MLLNEKKFPGKLLADPKIKVKALHLLSGKLIRSFYFSNKAAFQGKAF